jgi:hypothetical protein
VRISGNGARRAKIRDLMPLNLLMFLHHTGIFMAISCHFHFLSYYELTIPLQILTQSQELSTQGCILEAAIEAGTKEIINIKDTLNEWDSKVGDGDCGTTVSPILPILSECLSCF